MGDRGSRSWSRLRQAFLDARAAVAGGDPRAVRATREATKVLLDDVYRTRPIKDNPLWHDRATWLDEIFQHESRDDSNWRLVNPSTHYGALDLPAVHVGGWYDIHLDGTLRNFMGMRRQAPTERARSAQRLVIGPWSHWTPQLSVVGDVDFGPDGGSRPDGFALGSGSATGCRRTMPGLGAGADLRDGGQRLARRAGVAAGPDPVHAVVPGFRRAARPVATSGR